MAGRRSPMGDGGRRTNVRRTGDKSVAATVAGVEFGRGQPWGLTVSVPLGQSRLKEESGIFGFFIMRVNFTVK
jgi:hypothetical protein